MGGRDGREAGGYTRRRDEKNASGRLSDSARQKHISPSHIDRRRSRRDPTRASAREAHAWLAELEGRPEQVPFFCEVLRLSTSKPGAFLGLGSGEAANEGGGGTGAQRVASPCFVVAVSRLASREGQARPSMCRHARQTSFAHRAEVDGRRARARDGIGAGHQAMGSAHAIVPAQASIGASHRAFPGHGSGPGHGAFASNGIDGRRPWQRRRPWGRRTSWGLGRPPTQTLRR